MEAVEQGCGDEVVTVAEDIGLDAHTVAGNAFGRIPAAVYFGLDSFNNDTAAAVVVFGR
jgi:hypothetical protein